MLRAAPRWSVAALALAAIGLAGCAEEKGLPARPAVGAGPGPAPAAEAAKPAREDPAARAIVVEAIAAHTGGHPERLERIKAHHLLMKGDALFREENVPERDIDSTRESWAVWPNVYAFRIAYHPAPERDIVTSGTVTPSRGALRTFTGQDKPLNYTDLQATQWDMFAFDWTVVPKALAHPEAVFHQPASGTAPGGAFRSVKAYIPGQPEWTLRFSEATRLLERLDYIGYETGVVNKTLAYFDYSDRGGVKMPSRVEVHARQIRFWNLRKIEEYESFDAADKVDPKKFVLP